MRTNRRILAIATAALLLGISVAPVAALEVNLNNGVHIGNGPGGSGVNVNLGGNGSPNVASVGAGANNTNALATIRNSDGSLVDLGQEDGNTEGTVNLGGLAGLLDGINLGDIPGIDLPGGGGGGGDDDAVTPEQFAVVYASIGGSDQQALRVKCKAVLMQPQSFDVNVVRLCRLIARL